MQSARPVAVQPGRALLNHSLIRYLLVGVVNTLIGLTSIYAGLYLLGLGDVAANAAGYAVALLFGFALNRGWTFQTRDRPVRRMLRYGLVLAAVYAVNLVTVLYARDVWAIGSYAAQAAGIVPYTLTGYLGSRFLVFAGGASAGR